MGVDSNLTGIPDFDKLELIKQGYATIPSYTIAATGNTASSVVVTHNLGIVPIVFAQGATSNSSQYRIWAGSYWDSYSAGAGGINPLLVHNFNIYTTTTTVEFEIDSIQGSGSTTPGSSYNIVYYLLRAKADT